MAWSRVQYRQGAAAAADSFALAFSSNVTVGSLLVHSIADDNNAGNTTVVSDSKSNTYAQAGTVLTQSTGHLFIYYAMNAVAGATTVTNNPLGSSANIRLAIHEYAGIALTSALDQTAGTTGNSSAPNSGNTSATTNAIDLVFGGMTHYSSTQTITPGVTFSEIQEIEDASIMPFSTEDKGVVATGAQAANWTTGADVLWMARVACFKEAAPVSQIKVVSGEVLAHIKAISGEVIAHVKTLSGVANT